MSKMSSESSQSNKKFCPENQNDKEKIAFTPRDYQIQILETALKQNTIACLGTGTGKTFIAVLLIREMAKEVRIPYEKGGKRIFFLVPTVPLVTQQTKTIKDHTDLSVKAYYGSMDVDSWDHEQWDKEFKKAEVLVMTAEIFKIIIEHYFIPLNKINLIIIDECHRAKGDHPYRLAMNRFLDMNENERPRIFGLSASLINGKCKPHKLENELKELEKSLMCAITTANDLADLQKYGADPREFVIFYKKYNCPQLNDLFSLNNLISSTIKNNISEMETSLNQNDEEDIIFLKKPSKCINQLTNIMNTLGPWCASKAATIFHKELSSLLCHPLYHRYAEFLEPINAYLKNFKEKTQDLHIDSTNLIEWPPKLVRLLEIFHSIMESKTFRQNFTCTEVYNCDFKKNPEKYIQYLNGVKTFDILFNCIIFVKERIVAYVLNEFIKEISNKNSQFKFITSNFIVGHGGLKIGDGTMTVAQKNQKKILKEFRENKFNTLIATSVLEEGMDIQQCNVVIRFDLPMDFRSYVQSKGRARAKNSVYILLVEDEESKLSFWEDICDFKTIEQLLLSKCHEREIPDEEEIQKHLDDEIIPAYMPYGKRGPRIALTDAVSLIHRYCAKLPCDKATKLTPHFHFEQVEPDDPQKGFICTLRMPINSPLRQPIKSKIMARKKLAKMAAALEACIMLDKFEELNEYLVPNSNLVDKALQNELGTFEKEVTNDGTKPGTSKRKQIYKKKVSEFLKNCKPIPEEHCYLHLIKMDLVEPLAPSLNPRKRPLFKPSNSDQYFALLSSQKLPSEHGYYLEEMECFECEDIEIPKALGDVFESVAGAIFLDSGMSLNAVWEIYYPMMKEAIDHFSKDVPINPVRKFYELVTPLKITWDPVVKDNQTYIEAKLSDGRKFHGVGPNKKVAKLSAAKRAIAILAQN